MGGIGWLAGWASYSSTDFIFIVHQQLSAPPICPSLHNIPVLPWIRYSLEILEDCSLLQADGGTATVAGDPI